MNTFNFNSYEFVGNEAIFKYHDLNRQYTERVSFILGDEPYDHEVLDRAMFLAFIILGTSYYKAHPTNSISINCAQLDSWQVDFFNQVYQEGLSQYAYENNLTRDDLAQFTISTYDSPGAVSYQGSGILSLQSGGKDSLLVASLLNKKNTHYTPWYVSSSNDYPLVLDRLKSPLVLSKRKIDIEALNHAKLNGGLNGHVPVTFINLSLALIQAILLKKDTVLMAVAHEGDEPHGWVEDLPVNHQWSKTWQAEELFVKYVNRYISPDIKVGSPLRNKSELKVAEMFSSYTWKEFGDLFSSCNIANYRQGESNTKLTWCGNCPKCANSYLLFAPFMPIKLLQDRLGGDLFKKSSLLDTFKGLLGIDGFMKPFECVGEIEELRVAYHAAIKKGYSHLPFEVPESNFNKDKEYLSQGWITSLI